MLNDVTITNPTALIVIAIGLAMGGILKGATGAGMPVIAVPVIAAFYDVRLAVIIIVVPNFIINLRQLWAYRASNTTQKLTVQLVVSGMIGAAIGTYALVALPPTLLTLLMVGIIFIYIALRLLRPDFSISQDVADKTAWMAGGVGGILQGSLGISSPAAMTFLSAIRLPRPNFIFTASAFFAAMCIPQMIVATAYGLIHADIVILGLLATVPLLLALPVGDWIGKRMSAHVFDRAILVLLAILAIIQLAKVLT